MERVVNKILTISVAAYNMGKYIRQTLDSLIVLDILDKLEVFVVDDGGTDETLTIAQEYASKYPSTFYAVHKENGGYGSTVNYSIRHATGKYFKLLDGDDWFDTKILNDYVSMLERIDTDIIITPYINCIGDEKKERKRAILKKKMNEDLLVSEMAVDCVFGMWGITYKTSLLKESNMELPLHCLYTDRIYAVVPFALARTIRFVDMGIYCYRIGREGQSISVETRIRHVQDDMKVAGILYDFYENQKMQGNANLPYIQCRVVTYSRVVIKTILLKPITLETIKAIKEYDMVVKAKSIDIYHDMINPSPYKNFAIYLRVMRMLRYGILGYLFSKMIFEAGGGIGRRML